VITLEILKSALRLPDFDPIPSQRIMVPISRAMRPPEGVTPQQAGVLVLLYPENDDLQIVLTRRTDTLRGHTGQISFPGGRRDAQDESFTATALRETCEELGLCDPPVQIIGMLSPIYIPPSNFEVHPTVAALPERPIFHVNPSEVAEVFTLPLETLLDASTKSSEEREIQGMRMQIPFYNVRGHKVWGATAVMLSELEGRLRAVLLPLS
jgi:8-oxo-dGTP pyrophosphatase MutT (NUDIX family)